MKRDTSIIHSGYPEENSFIKDLLDWVESKGGRIELVESVKKPSHGLYLTSNGPFLYREGGKTIRQVIITIPKGGDK